MRTLPVIRQSPGQYDGNTYVGRAGYFDDFERLVSVGMAQARVRGVFEPEPWFRMTVSTMREGRATLVRQGKTTTHTYYVR